MAAKMHAAVVELFGKPLAFREVAVPTPGPGQILVKFEASGVCHTDLHAADGDAPTALIPRKHLFANPARASMSISPDGQWLSWMAPVNGVIWASSIYLFIETSSPNIAIFCLLVVLIFCKF